MQKSPHMPRRVPMLLLGILAILLTVISCTRDYEQPDDVESATAPYPTTFNFNCLTKAVYKDTFLCARYMGPNNDFFVSPFADAPKAKYYSWPAGLALDFRTGRINVTKSQGGIQYVIGVVQEGRTDTCHFRVVVSGIQYKDNVYVLANNDTLATPYFNANPAVTSLCDSSDDNDYPGNSGGHGNDKCEFDDGNDDDNGNGTLDEPPPGQQANDKNVRVRTKSGVINLKKSLADGAFGANPKNGDSTEVSIYYRLADCSMKNLKRIDVKLFFFEKQSDIPASFLTEIMDKKANFESGRPITKQGNPRPPMIVVTRE